MAPGVYVFGHSGAFGLDWCVNFYYIKAMSIVSKISALFSKRKPQNPTPSIAPETAVPPLSCIASIILNDLDDENNFITKTSINNYNYNTKYHLVHKKRKYELVYWYFSPASSILFYLEDCYSQQIFTKTEESLIKQKLNTIYNKYLQRERDNYHIQQLQKLSQWFSECKLTPEYQETIKN